MDCDCDCEIFFSQERKKVACARDRREHVPDFLIDLIDFFWSRLLIDLIDFLESGFDI